MVAHFTASKNREEKISRSDSLEKPRLYSYHFYVHKITAQKPYDIKFNGFPGTWVGFKNSLLEHSQDEHYKSV